MENYYEYLKTRYDALCAEAGKLKAEDRTDEANLARVKANIYEICGTVCRVHMSRPGGGADACRAQLEKFRTLWSADKERAAAHGDTGKAVIEDIKLEALADAAARFEEAVR